MKENWEVKKLGEVSKINYGYTEKASFTEVGPKFLRITDIQDNGVDWETVPYCKIDKSDLPKYLLKQGDIVFARTGATTGKSYLIKNPPSAVFASYLIKLQISDLEKLSPDFLILFFQTKNYWDKIQTGLSGSAQGGFNASKLADLSIPIPPLAEQQRIVAILDEAFAAVAKAKENAAKNLQNARELFDSYLQSVFANPGDGWEEKTLDEVCSFTNGQAHERIIDENGDYKLINSKFISTNGKVFKNTNKQLSPLFRGDIAMVMSDVPKGKTIAKCFLVDKDETYTLNQRICVIRSDKFEKRFLYYQLNRHKYLLAFDNGENQTNLRKNDILNSPLFVPPIAEQKAVIQKLDALSAETKKLENIYRQKINDLDELKKSILQKAFNGELTANNRVSSVIGM